MVSDLELYVESGNDLVRYAATYSVCELTGAVPERFVPFLVEIITNYEHFLKAQETPGDTEDRAFHPILSTLSDEQPVLPDKVVDAASFPWSNACSRFEAIRLLTRAESQENPLITQTYIDLL